jgi:hypothetical protein
VPDTTAAAVIWFYFTRARVDAKQTHVSLLADGQNEKKIKTLTRTRRD